MEILLLSSLCVGHLNIHMFVTHTLSCLSCISIWAGSLGKYFVLLQDIKSLAYISFVPIGIDYWCRNKEFKLLMIRILDIAEKKIKERKTIFQCFYPPMGETCRDININKVDDWQSSTRVCQIICLRRVWKKLTSNFYFISTCPY